MNFSTFLWSEGGLSLEAYFFSVILTWNKEQKVGFFMEENLKTILFQKSQSETLQYLVKTNFFTSNNCHILLAVITTCMSSG